MASRSGLLTLSAVLLVAGASAVHDLYAVYVRPRSGDRERAVRVEVQPGPVVGRDRDIVACREADLDGPLGHHRGPVNRAGETLGGGRNSIGSGLQVLRTVGDRLPGGLPFAPQPQAC